VKCPRCESAELEEHEREGVTVDACRTCRGIWLDRGELERLIARALRDIDELERPAERRRDPDDDRDRRDFRARERDDDRGRPDRPRTYDRDDDRHDWRRDDRYPRRRKHWLERLGDVFD